MLIINQNNYFKLNDSKTYYIHLILINLYKIHNFIHTYINIKFHTINQSTKFIAKT
jgi:hypothetical protein